MVRVKVLNKFDIIKYLVKVTVIIIAVTYITRYFLKISGREYEEDTLKEMAKQGTENIINKLSNQVFINCIDTSIPIIEYSRDESHIRDTVYETISRGGYKRVLDMELGLMDKLKQEQEIIETIEDPEIVVSETGLSISEVQDPVPVDTSSTESKFTNTYSTVKVKNESKYQLTEEILNPNLEIANKRNVLLFHTHTCESYTPTNANNYQMTGTYRTTDLNFNVARVGTELENKLKEKEFNVIHDKTLHDYPAYSGSYNRSFDTVQNLLNQNKDYEIVFDIHRDAIGNNSNYAPTVKVGEQYAAQLLFVIGTDGGGLNHPNWRNNLKFAIKVQEKANEMYPGLFKPIIVRNSRYNQNLAKEAVILEVGATGNTLEQTIVSMELLSNVLNEIL